MAPLSRENSGVKAPTDGPQPIEIVFSFDTTGSMGSCIAEVRKKVQEIMSRMNKDIPALRMSVFAHGDYCDAHNYVTKWLDFTTDVNELCDFVKNVGGTGGGDFPECYELVLRQVREELTWTSGTQRSLVMIGDAIPHEPSYPQNKLKIDWKEEVQRLGDMGVRIYSVQCGGNAQTESFCKTMADETSGKHLRLENFETIVDIMMSIVFRERGVEYFEEFEKEVRAREGAGIRFELDRMLNTLAERGDAPSTSPKTGVIPKAPPVPPVPTYLRRTSTITPPTTPAAKAKRPKTTPAKTVKPTLKRIRDAGIKKPKAETAKKSPSKTVKKVLRESVTDRHLLNGLEWNGWKQAMRPDEPSRSPYTWKPRQNNHPGYRCGGLFEDTETSAMFEVAVTSPDSQKKVPVWCGFSKGFKDKNWDSHFLRRPALKQEIDNLLERGCKLYVRRATGIKSDSMGHNGQSCSTMDELKNLVNQTYDYAWNRSEPRQLFLRRSRRSSVVARRGQPY